MNTNMQSLGLTGVQSRVMHYILVKSADGPVFQRDVEAVFGLSRSTATGILQSMEKNDLILRESVASDARLKSLIPTQKAAYLDAQVGEYLRNTEQCLTRGLSNAQLALFLRLWHTCLKIWMNSRFRALCFHNHFDTLRMYLRLYHALKEE